MVVPEFSQITPEFLKLLKDKKTHSMKNLTIYLENYFKLTQEERIKQKASGGETIFHNRVHWTKYYLKKAGLLIDMKKGHVKITTEGLKILKKNLKKIDRQFLNNYST